MVVLFTKMNYQEEPHPQPPPISKVYPFLRPVAGVFRGGARRGLRME
ncbi:hypothetical protein NSP_290 [Nodularia spumigena CCY9414]|nr:hypothetical protein NSP_290 [Nodularia spumigena CCY9414]